MILSYFDGTKFGQKHAFVFAKSKVRFAKFKEALRMFKV